MSIIDNWIFNYQMSTIKLMFDHQMVCDQNWLCFLPSLFIKIFNTRKGCWRWGEGGVLTLPELTERVLTWYRGEFCFSWTSSPWFPVVVLYPFTRCPRKISYQTSKSYWSSLPWFLHKGENFISVRNLATRSSKQRRTTCFPLSEGAHVNIITPRFWCN